VPARLTPSLMAASALLVGCASLGTSPGPASQQPSAPSTRVTTSATQVAAPSMTALPAGAVRLTVVPDRSTATIRVREQVANVPAPGDAVLTSRAFSGGLVLLADGTFAPGSTIAIDLDTLSSDSSLRDEWIKVNTLRTAQFPRAEFTAQSVTGVPLPLPATGEWQAELRGVMRIHGVDREVRWPLLVTRGGGELLAKGATTFRFGDHGMAVPANRMILSVVDEIRLEVDVVARIGG